MLTEVSSQCFFFVFSKINYEGPRDLQLLFLLWIPIVSFSTTLRLLGLALQQAPRKLHLRCKHRWHPQVRYPRSARTLTLHDRGLLRSIQSPHA